MVDTTFLIVVVIFFVGAIVIFKIVKGLMKAAILLAALLAVIFAGVLVLVVLDVQDFSEKFGQEPVLFLMIENGTGTAGVEFIAGQKELVPEIEVERYSLFLYEKDVPVLTQDHYKVILIEKSLLLDSTLKEGEYDLGLEDENYNVRNEAFAAAISDVVESPFLIARNIRDDRMKVRPETIAFKVVNALPESFTKIITSKVQQTAERIFQANEE